MKLFFLSIEGVECTWAGSTAIKLNRDHYYIVLRCLVIAAPGYRVQYKVNGYYDY